MHLDYKFKILKKITEPNRDNFEDEEYKKALEEYNYDLIKQELQIADLDRYGIKICLIDSYEEITEILEIILNKNAGVKGSDANIVKLVKLIFLTISNLDSINSLVSFLLKK